MALVVAGALARPPQPPMEHRVPSSAAMCSFFTQIYEGANQVQRIVMARQLLRD